MPAVSMGCQQPTTCTQSALHVGECGCARSECVELLEQAAQQPNHSKPTVLRGHVASTAWRHCTATSSLTGAAPTAPTGPNAIASHPHTDILTALLSYALRTGSSWLAERAAPY